MTLVSGTHWYAVYTNHNSERKLAAAVLQLNQDFNRDYQIYLPLKHDHSSPLSVSPKPLFRNYVFIRHDDSAFSKVKYLKGFNRYVSTGIKPTPIPEGDMSLIRKIADHQCADTRLIAIQKTGKRAKICQGAFSGYSGVMVDNGADNTVAIEIDSLGMSACVEFSKSDIALFS